MARTWKRAGYWLRTCCSCWGSGNSPPLSALAVSSAAEAWALLSLLPAAAREVSTLLVMTARRAATAGVPVSWSSLCLCPGPPRVLVLTVPWSSLCPRCVLVLAVSWSCVLVLPVSWSSQRWQCHHCYSSLRRRDRASANPAANFGFRSRSFAQTLANELPLWFSSHRAAPLVL